MGWRGPFRDERQLQVVDDFVHHGIVGEEGDDAHLAAAFGAGQRIDLIDLADHLGPAFGGETPEFVFGNPERKSGEVCLLDLAPRGVGVQAV